MGLDVPLAVRTAAAPRGAGHRPVARLRHLRQQRSAECRQAGDARPADRRQDHPAASGARAHQPGEEPHGGARQGRQRHLSRRADRQDLRRLRQGARASQRARLRRPAAEDRRVVRARGRARQVPAPVPLRDDRRVPGHQPAAVPADQASGRQGAQPRGGRRSRSVDLQVAWRGPAQHPRLRTGFSRGRHRAPRAELPLDPEHPRRRVGRHRQQHGPQGEAAVDRAGPGRPDHVLPRRGRTRGGVVHRPRTAQGDDVAP